MSVWSVRPSHYDKKDKTRPTKKICSICHRVGWFKPRERRCPRIRVETRGAGIFASSTQWLCRGTLTAVIRKPPRADLPVVAERKRKAAARQQARAEARVMALRTRIKRLQTALRKQQKRASHYARMATRSDAEIAAAQDRIKVAQRVQVATRRLMKAAGVTAAEGVVE